MNKKFLAIGIGVVAVGLIVGLVLNQSRSSNSNTSSTDTTDNTNSETTTTTETNEQPAEESEAAETVAVSIQDQAYSPATITIKKGTTVTWTNKDSVKHDVMPNEPGESFEPSELLGQGESYSFTFHTVGSYSYTCTPHPFMKGTVVVTE